jgi:putative AdoMet-dependent methyltransferase
LNTRKTLFEDWVSSYDQSVSEQSFPFLGYDLALQVVVRESHAKQHSRILELGTGTGNLAQLFAALGCDLVCTDFSSGMLEATKQKISNAEFLELDLTVQTDWQKISGHFDCIVASYVLHEFPLEWNVKFLTHLAANHLSPNGRIVFADIAFPNAETRASAAQFWAKVWDADEFYFAAAETISSFQAIGFEAQHQQISACAGVFTLKLEIKWNQT